MAPPSAVAGTATGSVWCTNSFSPAVRFNLPVELETSVTPSTVAPGETFEVGLQATVRLSESIVQGMLNQAPSLTEITVNRVFVSIPDPVGATAVGEGLALEWSPGVVAISSAPGVAIAGGVPLTSPTISRTFTVTGAAGDTIAFELDPAAIGSAAAVSAGGTVWSAGGKAAAIEVDLTVFGVVKVGFDCADGGLTQSAGPDQVMGTVDDVYDDPVVDNQPFLSVGIAAGSGSSTSSTTSTTTAPSSTSSTSTTSSTTSSTTTSTTAAPSTTTTAPLTTHLPSGSVSVSYTCLGADPSTTALLSGLGGGSLPIAVVLSSDPIESPEPGESFALPLRWQLTMDQGVVDMALGLGITSFAVSDAGYTAGVTAGATGPDHVAHPPARTVPIGSSASFTEGPFAATFTRTGDVGDPITVVAKGVSLVITLNLGGPVPLALTCSGSGPASFTLVDSEGVPPPASPAAAAGGPSTGVAGTQASRQLARTGSALIWQVVVALVLIESGLLVHAASSKARR